MSRKVTFFRAFNMKMMCKIPVWKIINTLLEVYESICPVAWRKLRCGIGFR